MERKDDLPDSRQEAVEQILWRCGIRKLVYLPERREFLFHYILDKTRNPVCRCEGKVLLKKQFLELRLQTELTAGGKLEMKQRFFWDRQLERQFNKKLLLMNRQLQQDERIR